MAESIRVLRLVKAAFAPGLDGEGARRFPGRWNPRGAAMVYTSANVALAVLETFVHLPPQMRRADAFPHLVLVTLAIDPHAVDTAPLPHPADLTTCRKFGGDWLARRGSVGLWVPSHVIPQDRNLLLNPEHPDFATKVTLLGQEPFSYDPRMVSA